MKRCIVLVAVLAVVCTACETWPWQKNRNPPVAQMDSQNAPPKDANTKEPYVAPVVPEPGLALSSDQRFKDVPLPIGIKEDSERTFVYESAAFAVGRMVYTSRASLYDLIQFFAKECPTAGWKLDNVLEAGGKTLFFKKSGKNLEVNVQDKGVGGGRRLMITLTPDQGPGGGA
jgi:hypothetical protein